MKLFAIYILPLLCFGLLVLPASGAANKGAPGPAPAPGPATKNGGGGTGGTTKTNAPTPSPGLIETHPCIPFNDPVVQAARFAISNKVYSPQCDTNNCTGTYGTGCCRYHTSVLSCDNLGFLFPQVPVSVL